MIRFLRRREVMISCMLLYTAALWAAILLNDDYPGWLVLAQTLPPLVASGILIHVTLQHQGAYRKFWLLNSLGTAAYGAAQLIWAWYACILNVDPPKFSMADVLWNMQTLLFLSALFYLMLRERGASYGARFLFDTLILMLVLLTLAWEFVLRPCVEQMSGSASFREIITVLLYPLTDIFIVIVLLTYHFAYRPLLQPRVLILLSIGFGLFVLADFLYFIGVSEGTYTTGDWFDPCWAAGLFLISLAGVYSIGAGAHHRSEAEESTRIRRIRFIYPYVGLLLLFGLMAERINRVDGIVIGTVGAISLIIMRQIGMLFVNESLVERLKQMLDSSQYLATHDELSGLANKRLIEYRIEEAIGRLQPDEQLAVMFMDLDRFKYINDTLGHAVGDQLIIQVGSRIAEAIGPSHLVARQGGDEFTVLIDSMGSRSEVSRIAEAIIAAISIPFRIEHHEIQTSTSIGIALYPHNGRDREELMKHADAAMYKAKELGGGRYQFFSESFKGELLKRMAMEHMLRQAVDRGELFLQYQPQVDSASYRLVGAEALLRWKREDGTMVSPADFIPVAEETGLIVPIGEWVIRTACLQAVEWDLAGLPPIRIAVNASPKQLVQDRFVDIVAGIITETGIDPTRLVMEITEGIALLGTEETTQTLQQLKRLGISISMDDFGTGYSSLGYLKTFQVDSLKIAQSFVSSMTEEEEYEGIVRAIMAMADSLHLSVIVEGVETEAQLMMLKGIRECVIQGYYFHRPLLPEQVAELLEKLPAEQQAPRGS